MGCPRRSRNWTSFSSPWARAGDGHDVVDLAVGYLALDLGGSHSPARSGRLIFIRPDLVPHISEWASVLTADLAARALVSAGAGARDHLRAAIQVLSEPAERHVFRHTGWRYHDGRWVYLFQGGGVGVDSLTVELDPPLDRFILPPAVEDVRDAVRLSLRLLDAAPASVLGRSPKLTHFCSSKLTHLWILDQPLGA